MQAAFQAHVHAEAARRKEHTESSLSYQLSQQLHIQAATTAQVIAALTYGLQFGFRRLAASSPLRASIRHGAAAPTVRFDAFCDDGLLCMWVDLEAAPAPVGDAPCLEAAFTLCKYSSAALKLFSLRADESCFDELANAITQTTTRSEGVETMRWFRPKQYSGKVSA